MSQTTKLLFIIAFFWLAQYVYVPNSAPYLLGQKVAADFVGVIVGVYGGMQMALRFPVGVMADILGKHKPIIILGCALSASASIIRILWSNGEGFFLGNVCSGIASALWVSFMLLYTKNIPHNKMQQALGYVFAANNIGILVAFVISAVLYQYLGMGFLCAVSIVSGSLAVILALSLTDNPPVPAATPAAATPATDSPAAATPPAPTATTEPTATTSNVAATTIDEQVATATNGKQSATATTVTTVTDREQSATTATTAPTKDKQAQGATTTTTPTPQKAIPWERPPLIELLKVVFKGRIWFFAFLAAIQQGLTMGTIMSFSNEAALQIGGTSFEMGLMTICFVGFCVISSYLSSSSFILRLGPAVPMVVTLFLLSAYCFLTMVVTNIYLLIAIQAFLGSSMGFLFCIANGEALVGIETYRRSSALGLFQAIFALGMTIIPMICGMLIKSNQGDLAPAFAFQGYFALSGAILTIIFYSCQKLKHKPQQPTA